MSELPTHRIKVKLEGSTQWIDLGPLWQKANGDFSGRTDLPNSLDNVTTIIVKANRPKPKAQPAITAKPAA